MILLWTGGETLACSSLPVVRCLVSVFLSSGVTQACLNAVGKMPVRRDVLMMCVSEGISAGEIVCRRWGRIVFRGQVVGWLEKISLETSSSVRGEKEERRWMLEVDAQSLVWCSQRTSVKPGLEGVLHAGLQEIGQIFSRQLVRVENNLSVAQFTSNDKKRVGWKRGWYHRGKSRRRKRTLDFV